MPLCFLPSLNGGPQKLYLDESGTLGYSGEIFTMAIVLVRDLPGLETSVAKHRVTQTESKASQMKTAQKLALARTLIEENGLEIFLADLDPRAAIVSERKLDKDMLYDSMAGQALAYYLQRGDLQRGLAYRLSMDIRGSLRESYEDLVRDSIGNVLMHRDEPLVTDIDVRFLDSKFSAGVQAADLFSNVYRTALTQKGSPCQGFLRKYVDQGVVHAGFTFGLPQLADQMMQIANDLRALVELEAGTPYTSFFNEEPSGEAADAASETGLAGDGGRDGAPGSENGAGSGSRRTRGRRGGRGRRGSELREEAREENGARADVGDERAADGARAGETHENGRTTVEQAVETPADVVVYASEESPDVEVRAGHRGAGRRTRRARSGRVADAESVEVADAVDAIRMDVQTGDAYEAAARGDAVEMGEGHEAAPEEGTDTQTGDSLTGRGTSRSARRRRSRSARITHRLASEAETAEEAASLVTNTASEPATAEASDDTAGNEAPEETPERPAHVDVHPGRALRLRQAESRSRRVTRTHKTSPKAGESAASVETIEERSVANAATSAEPEVAHVATDDANPAQQPASGTENQAESPAKAARRRGRVARTHRTEASGAASPKEDASGTVASSDGAAGAMAHGNSDTHGAEGRSTSENASHDASLAAPTTPTDEFAHGTSARGNGADASTEASTEPVLQAGAATPSTDANASQSAEGTPAGAAAKPTRTRTRTRKRAAAAKDATDAENASAKSAVASKDAPTEHTATGKAAPAKASGRAHAQASMPHTSAVSERPESDDPANALAMPTASGEPASDTPASTPHALPVLAAPAFDESTAPSMQAPVTPAAAGEQAHAMPGDSAALVNAEPHTSTPTPEGAGEKAASEKPKRRTRTRRNTKKAAGSDAPETSAAPADAAQE